MSELQTYPIVLAHGIARFDLLSEWLLHIDNDADDDGLHYFRNIRTHLMAAGRFDVHHSHVSWAGAVAQRAAELAANVERVLSATGAPKLHIIGHSMGGLDARHMLFMNRDKGLHQRIASVTTIGTPHHGSPIADLALDADNLIGGLADAVRRVGLGPNIAGIHDLTTTACQAFNERAEAWEQGCGVKFQAYAGAQRLNKIFRPIRPLAKLIGEPNDGLVAVTSARWRPEYFVGPVLDADHLNLIGWVDIAELPDLVSFLRMESRIKALYLAIAEGLAQRFPV